MRNFLFLLVGLVVVPPPPVPPLVTPPGAGAAARLAVRAPQERCSDHAKRDTTTARRPSSADRQHRVARAR